MEDAEECGRSSTTFVDFEDFTITANDIILDYQIPESIRLKYYELCRAQKSYLHSGLLATISGSLAAKFISDTVKIADAIKSSNISTPQSDFALWDKTLAGFESLGIEVGFLRARVTKLSRLADNTPQAERDELRFLEEASAPW
ncbi:OLC1v1018865C1 [Oldenlandia corymbosa var. corymbosa]|uniref:OLC1v1018865C1 n=1 Tax=Oldenlandia corymbosa var. corymbosa TaxID=529605 RepID=A0AAV1ED23_OLDCO|nr:OLC1v1018865C1 [Oldenlandia corymbosa var. corymbosa]